MEQMQARHRRELKDLQGRITGKKKNATKKTRKGVNDECAEMERQLREKQAGELAALNENGDDNDDSANEETQQDDDDDDDDDDALANEAAKLNIIHKQDENDDAKKEEDEFSIPQQQQQQQQQQGGKKRNRQKERMARRAAEKEAETLRAEEEAANMTDHRKLEGEFMNKTIKAKGLVEKEIAPDGHCLFSAVADQLGHVGVSVAQKGGGGGGEKEAEYRVVRKRATEYMAAHADDFAPFLEEDFDAYVAKMRDTAEWGGQLELMALAKSYGVGICVVQDGRIERLGDVQEGDEDGKLLWLAYYRHGYGLGEHYNSLRRK